MVVIGSPSGVEVVVVVVLILVSVASVGVTPFGVVFVLVFTTSFL